MKFVSDSQIEDLAMEVADSGAINSQSPSREVYDVVKRYMQSAGFPLRKSLILLMVKMSYYKLKVLIETTKSEIG